MRPEQREEEGRSGVGQTPRGKTQAPCRAGQRHGCSPRGLHGGTAPTLVTAPRVVGEVLQGQGDRGPGGPGRQEDRQGTSGLSPPPPGHQVHQAQSFPTLTSRHSGEGCWSSSPPRRCGPCSSEPCGRSWEPHTTWPCPRGWTSLSLSFRVFSQGGCASRSVPSGRKKVEAPICNPRPSDACWLFRDLSFIRGREG